MRAMLVVALIMVLSSISYAKEKIKCVDMSKDLGMIKYICDGHNETTSKSITVYPDGAFSEIIYIHDNHFLEKFKEKINCTDVSKSSGNIKYICNGHNETTSKTITVYPDYTFLETISVHDNHFLEKFDVQEENYMDY